MSKVRLTGSTSGYTEIQASAVAGDNTLNLPTTANGTLVAADSNDEISVSGGNIGGLDIDAGASANSVNLDSSGRLLVGTSSNLTNARVQVEGTDFNTAGASLRRNSNDGGGSSLRLNKSRGTSVGSNTVVQNGDGLGVIIFAGSDGTNDLQGVYISGEVDGTPGTNDMPGRLIFATTADGASSPTERMRISQDGSVLFNRLSRINGGQICIDYANGSSAGLVVKDKQTTGTGVVLHVVNGSGSIIGGISQNQSTTAFNTSSDYRLKENVVPLTGAADRLNLLQVHRFNFIANPDTTVDGFIAHEAQAVVPECVTGTKDEVDADGNPVYQGIDQSKLVPLLTAALQEALAEIADLKTRITALEAA